MKKLYVLLDNGHGNNTPGKRSPKLSNGSQFFEWQFTREVVDALYERLKTSQQFVPIKITPENNDISLTTRVKRINQYCFKYGAANCIIISVHVNASGNGQWMKARGWSAWTTKGVTISDRLAECLYEGADFVLKNKKMMLEEKSDGDRDFEAGFAILKGANCAAVLTENFFMDNKQDVEYLMGPTGLNDVVCIHMKGIENYYNKYCKK